MAHARGDRLSHVFGPRHGLARVVAGRASLKEKEYFTFVCLETGGIKWNDDNWKSADE